MPAAVRADNLCPCHSQRPVLVTGDSAGQAVKVRWPAAARLEFMLRLVQGGLATGAGIDALLRVVLVKRARARRLCALLAEDAELFCKLVVSAQYPDITGL